MVQVVSVTGCFGASGDDVTSYFGVSSDDVVGFFGVSSDVVIMIQKCGKTHGERNVVAHLILKGC